MRRPVSRSSEVRSSSTLSARRDDDAGLRRVDRAEDLVRVALQLNTRHSGVERRFRRRCGSQVLVEEMGVVTLVGIPLLSPGDRGCRGETDRMLPYGPELTPVMDDYRHVESRRVQGLPATRPRTPAMQACPSSAKAALIRSSFAERL